MIVTGFLLDDDVVSVRSVRLRSLVVISRKTAHNGIVADFSAGVVAAPGINVYHVDTAQKRVLDTREKMLGQYHRTIMKMKRVRATHILHPDGVVLNQRPRCPEQHDPTICRIIDHVILNKRVRARNADTIRPLLEIIRAAGTDIIVLHRGVVAEETTFGDV